MSPEVAALHKPIADLKLKEGETIRVNIKNKVSAPKKSSTTSSMQSAPKILAPPPPTRAQQSSETTEWATFD